MTQNKRIAINVVATYGRSLFSLVCGLFTARWVLMMLGESDYGVYGLVGGLTAFVTFLNSMLSVAVGRFYAYSVGEAKLPGNANLGLEECRKWFNTAVTIHTVVPVVLVLVGYPIGEWAVREFLTIPEDRIGVFVWVWRMSCLSCFVGMVSVPYSAMYIAKQEIAELTIYSVVTTGLNVGVLYYMVSHPSDWVVRYAIWVMLMSVVPQLIIAGRALQQYPECRFRYKYLFLWGHLRKILSFSGYRLINSIGMICSNQGQSVVVNKYLGPSSNAAVTVGNSVASHAQSLAAAISGAFSPAITTAAGEKDYLKMQTLALRTCKFGALALLLFSIPLTIEMDTVLHLWLKNPPRGAASLCTCVLVTAVLEKMTDGHWMSIFAIGKIAGYQLVVSACGFIAVAFGWFFVSHGLGVVSVGYALILAKMFAMGVRFYFARTVAGLSVMSWTRGVLLPVLITVSVTSLVGLVPRQIASPSFIRVLFTSGVCVVIFIGMLYGVALTQEERLFVLSRISKKMRPKV